MKRIVIAIALSACLLASCSPQARSELAAARSRWQAAGISHYRFNLGVGCFCPYTQKMPLNIEVMDGRVVSMQFKDGSPVSASEQKIFEEYQTIEALFDFTEGAIGKADEIQVAYDPTYGFPVRVNIDYIKQAVDDELMLSVSDFQPLPPT